MAASYSGEYEVPWLAELLHSFPHRDLTFQLTNSSFYPEHPRYREVLLFWGALPVLWLLVTLLVFLMYFCYRCCQKDASKKRHGSCLPWAMAILALLTGGVIGVGFYGNEEIHKGALEISAAGEDADITVHHMQTQIHELQRIVDNEFVPRLNELKRLFDRHQRIDPDDMPELERLTNAALSHSSNIASSVSGIDTKAQNINLTHHLNRTKEYAFYRWVGTIVLLCWQVLLVLLLLFGIGKSSKCTLLMFCAFGIFTLVLCWVSAGLHLAVSVALGDFCMSPDIYVEKYSTQNFDKDILRYYIKCNNEVVNPFSRSLKTAFDSVTSANKTVNKAINVAERSIERSEMVPYIQQMDTALDKTVQRVQQLTALVECNNLHRDYEHAVHGVCYMALPGIVFVLLSAAAAGLMLTTLVLLASCAWRHFGPRKGYREVDEDETFLPRNDNASPSYYRYAGSEPPGSCSDSVHDEVPATPSGPDVIYPRELLEYVDSFPRGRHSNPREHKPMHRRSSPPPAYSANEFYRQYGDVSHDQHTPPSRPDSRA